MPFIFTLTGAYLSITIIFLVVLSILHGIKYMDILAEEYNVNGPKMSLVYKRITGNFSRYLIDIFTAMS